MDRGPWRFPKFRTVLVTNGSARTLARLPGIEAMSGTQQSLIPSRTNYALLPRKPQAGSDREVGGSA